MSGRTTEHQTPEPMTDEEMREIEGSIAAGELYDENTLLDIVEDLIATVREKANALREATEARDAAGYSAAELMKLLIKADQERDEARAEVERLKAALEEAREVFGLIREADALKH